MLALYILTCSSPQATWIGFPGAKEGKRRGRDKVPEYLARCFKRAELIPYASGRVGIGKFHMVAILALDVMSLKILIARHTCAGGRLGHGTRVDHHAGSECSDA